MSLHDSWVIYSTYDPDGKASPYAGAQLAAYRAAGFSVLVVDTSPDVDEKRRSDWDEQSTRWFSRANEGYDFKSYQIGLQFLQKEVGVDLAAATLIFTNDSCYGPYQNVSAILETLENKATGSRPAVFGITDSFERRYHLQSYWLYVRPDATQFVVSFFEKLGQILNRDDAISLGELGLSEFLLGQGCELVPYSRTSEVVARYSGLHILSLAEFITRRLLKRPKYSKSGDGACIKHLLKKSEPYLWGNQMLDFAGPLFYEGKLPFLKRRLISENPNGEVLIRRTKDTVNLTNDEVAEIVRKSPVLIRRYGTSTSPKVQP